MRKMMIATGAVAILAAAGCGASQAQHHSAGHSVSSAPYQGTNPSASATNSPASTPASSVTRTKKFIVYKVSGTGFPSVTYGDDSQNFSPTGPGTGLGVLGDGVQLPWRAQVRLTNNEVSNALYFAVNAQLEGGGNIHTGVYLKVTSYFSDGTHLSQLKKLAGAHAIGGYNIANAEYVNN